MQPRPQQWSAWTIPDAFFALRPVLWFPVWTVILAGTRGEGLFKESGLSGWLVGISLSLFMGAVYLQNQVKDFDTDRINRKLPYLHRGAVSLRLANFLFYGLLLVSSLLLFAAGYWILLLIAAGLVVVTAFLYNLGKMAQKNNALGSVLVTVIAGAGLWILGHYLSGTEQFHWSSPTVYGLAFGAVGILTGIPDEAGDRRTGKQTLAVVLGARRAAWIASFILLNALALAVLFSDLVMAICAGISLPLFIWAALSGNRTAVFAAIKGSVFLLSILIAIFWYPVYLIWIFGIFAIARLYHKYRFNLAYPSFSLMD